MPSENPISVHPLVQSAEGVGILFPDGLRPVRMGGEPVQAFLEGWQGTIAWVVLADLVILPLVHRDGPEAVWYLDGKLERLGDQLESLPLGILERLAAALQPIRHELWLAFTGYETRALSPASAVLMQLTRSCRLILLDLLNKKSPIAVNFIDIAAIDGEVLAILRNEHARLLNLDIARKIIGSSILDQVIAWCGNDQTRAWPSPVTGAAMHPGGGVFLDDFRFVYRMVDQASGLVIFVVVSEHFEKVLGLYFPETETLITSSRPSSALEESLNEPRAMSGSINGQHLLEAFFHEGVRTILERHFWEFLPELPEYFSNQPYHVSCILRGRPGVHIGHQLWNELTALAVIADALPPAALPQLIVPNCGEGVEIYGPVDALLPEWAGKVERLEDAVLALRGLAYQKRWLMARPADVYVSQGLRERLERVMPADTALAQELSIVIGLRVENRTHVALQPFLTALLERVASLLGRCTFVIDGHNRRMADDPDSVFESHHEHSASMRPHDVERQIAAALAAHFEGSQTRVVSTICAPMAESIAKIRASRFFIAFWGAGLAKYRWAANLPGFVITSQWNLLYRQDLHIYDGSNYMENPTEQCFVDSQLVTDRMDVEPLVLVGPTLQPSYANFDLAAEEIWPALEAFILRHINS